MADTDLDIPLSERISSLSHRLEAKDPAGFLPWVTSLTTALKSQGLEWTIESNRPSISSDPSKRRKYNMRLAWALSIIHNSIDRDAFTVIFDAKDPCDAVKRLRAKFHPDGGSSSLLLKEIITSLPLAEGGDLSKWWNAKDLAQRQLVSMNNPISIPSFIISIVNGLPESRKTLGSELSSIVANAELDAAGKLDRATC